MRTHQPIRVPVAGRVFVGTWVTTLRVATTSAATLMTSAQGDGSTERQHQRSEFCLLLCSPRLALLFIIFFNATQPPRIVAASILALCLLLTAHALALCVNVMRRRPSCRACTASLLRVGCCGWLGPTDGPGYDERATWKQDATTDREGADHANWLSRGCEARG